MDQTVLCLNSGSSSLKFAVYRLAEAAEQHLFSGAVEAIGAPGGRTWLRSARSIISDRSGSFPDYSAAIKTMLAALHQQGVKDFSAAGHRIVHGGPAFIAPQLVDEKLKQALRDLVPFAPLHLPSQLAMIEAVADHFPDLRQVACFDTAFHAAIPEIALRFPLPDELWRKGIRRYGFHGLSYEYVVSRLGKDLGERAIVAHLGNGASMVALRHGCPIDTSMGLTPTGGFMMGTRSGDLDPGVLLYLLGQGYSRGQLETLLNHKSGLLGVSGQTSEMKALLERRDHDPAADLAIKMFCYQVRKFIGAFAAALDGLDTLVFTGGIGEHSSPVRAQISQGLAYLGIELDGDANNSNAEVVSRPETPCMVRVVQTDEDLMIARHVRKVLMAQ